MQESQETRKNPSGDSQDDLEKAQANTGSEVREGQENSSILHDQDQEDKELPKDIKKPDISSTSQEEFIEDKNTGSRRS